MIIKVLSLENFFYFYFFYHLSSLRDLNSLLVYILVVRCPQSEPVSQ